MEMFLRKMARFLMPDSIFPFLHMGFLRFIDAVSVYGLLVLTMLIAIKSREAGLHSSASLKIKSNTMKNTWQRYASYFSFPRIMLFF